MLIDIHSDIYIYSYIMSFQTLNKHILVLIRKKKYANIDYAD